MRQFVKSLLLLALLCLCGMELQAQTKPAKKYPLFFEKVYLHTDRDQYASGEDVWFKAYLVNGQNNQPIGTSNNLYVELISPRAEIVQREIIRLDFGVGNGDFKLNDTIATGKYRLRAYTNWMRNFGDNFVFEKSIDIINPQVKKQDVIVDNKQPAKQAIRFYPEGGSLIEGISSLVAVKAEDSFGKGMAAKGAVISSAGDTVSRFACDTMGMGLCTLLPIKGLTYFAKVNNSNTAYQVSLPAALSSGLTLSVKRTDLAVNVLVNCNDAAFAGYKDHQFTISDKHGGISCFKQQFVLSANQMLIKIPISIFPEGVASITLYDDGDKPHSERLVYIDHNNTKNQLAITTDQPFYPSKSKVTLKLKLGDASAKANLSLAVVDASLSPVPTENIVSYLLLQSELRGTIEQANRYFDTTNVSRLKQLDLLLMTQGWRDFVWRRMQDTALTITYKSESGIDITGTVKNERNEKALANLNITLFASAAKGIKLFSALTDSTGKFTFNGLQYYGIHAVKLSSTDNKGEKKGTFNIDTLSVIPVKSMMNIVKDSLPTGGLLKAVALRQKEVADERLRKLNVLKEVKITAKKTTILSDVVANTFGYPDQEFTISKKDEYYQALDNWLAHNVKGAVINDQPGVMFVGQGAESKLSDNGKLMYPRIITNGKEVVPPLGKYTLTNNQDVYLDISDEDLAMQQSILSPYWNLTMDKITKVIFRRLIGVDPNYGKTIDVYLLYLTLKDGALDGYNLGVANPLITGYYETRDFYKPEYNTKGDLTKPDLRSTIHWEPNIKIGTNDEATVNYYNADPKGKMRIIVQGVTDKGVPVYSTINYLVK